MQQPDIYKDNPQLKAFVVGLPDRFKTGSCKCDECKVIDLTPLTFSVFVTPAPPYKVMVVCLNCLKRLYIQNDYSNKN